MKLSFIGVGYVGLVSASCFADVGNEVICIDKNVSKIDGLKAGKIPIYEQGLSEIVNRNIREERLFFTTDLAAGIADSEVCFIAVDTPCDIEGHADITNVINVAEAIGDSLDHDMVVVTKSTVPVGTTMRVKEIICDKLRKRGKDISLVKIASNPEFLKEGDALNDFKKPDRVIVGTESGRTDVADLLHEIYSPYMRKTDRFKHMDIASAELTKYASNAMLATRISYMNSLARICEKIGADIEQVRKGMGSDPRIGSDFLFAGIGYGGSCFPKDVKALISLGREYGEYLPVVEGAQRVNDEQPDWFFKKIENYFSDKGGLKDKTAAVLGIAFKANTDDIRESCALNLINMLVGSGISVRVYDPIAMDNARECFGEKIGYSSDIYQCAHNTGLLVICTEWSEFRFPDWAKLKNIMKHFVIFDGRNLYSGAHRVENCFGVGVNNNI